MDWASEELSRRGYAVEPAGEWGADYFASRDGQKLAVRSRLSGTVGPALVLELEGARRYFDCDGGLLLSTGRVLDEAETVARKLGIVVERLELSGERLWSWLSQRRGELPEELLREVVAQILQGAVLSREQINDLAGARSSSGVIALLTELPDFEFGGYPAGLRLRTAGQASSISLRDLGYQGFRSIRDLRQDVSEIPSDRGLYVVQWESGEPEFMNRGSGGHSKGDPNVPVGTLRSNWVPGAAIVYAGKAGGEGTKATLRSRVKQFLEFGQGKPAKHYGGRYLWQLREAPDLLMAWKIGDPAALEEELLLPFVAAHGRLPFANLQE